MSKFLASIVAKGTPASPQAALTGLPELKARDAPINLHTRIPTVGSSTEPFMKHYHSLDDSSVLSS
ncbi:MAG: hypothetical protein U1E61_21885 [Bradyrhizobium sp.]